jgi:valyl-tRNA synthetase
VISGIRNIRGEMNIAPGKPVPVLLQDASARDVACLKANRPYLNSLARTESINILEPTETAPESATALVGNMKVLIPLGSLIDREAELQRLGREIDKRNKELEQVRAKLANPNFAQRAPEAVVAKEKTRLSDLEAALANLANQRDRVNRLD